MWALAKHTFRSLWNSIIILSFDFISPNQIVNMSMNGLRRRVASRHKILTKTLIYESSIALDSWHQITIRGTPLYDFVSRKMACLRIYGTRFFLSKAQCNFWTSGHFWRSYHVLFPCIKYRILEITNSLHDEEGTSMHF